MIRYSAENLRRKKNTGFTEFQRTAALYGYVGGKSSNRGGNLRFDLKTKGNGSAIAYIELRRLGLDRNPE
jgi:hypothetical protein